MRVLRNVIVTTAVAALAACTMTATELLSVDKEAAADRYGMILVLSVSDNGQIRQIVEQDISEKLNAAGVDSKVASLFMPGGLDKEKPDTIRVAAEDVVKRTGVDAVLVTVLLQEEVRQQYVPPRNDVVAVGNVPYFMGYGTFVGYHYENVYTPGYLNEQKDYFVQTTLFDVSTGTAVWRAQSKTVDPVSMHKGIASFSDAVVGRLQRDGVLKAK